MENGKISQTKFLGEALTFDDVLLVPSYSEILPREVDISTQFTTGIRLNVPVVSAAMDTVTEEKLAIAIARQGGIGIIHKNMSIEAQAEQVRKVKRSESGMIIDPVTLEDTATVGDALTMMRHFRIGGIPIVDKSGKLIGILTNRDLRFENDATKSVRQVMTSENLITAPIGTDLEKAKGILQYHKIEKLPVVDDQRHLVGLITYKDLMKVEDYPNSCKDKLGRLVVGAAVGVTYDMLDRVTALVNVGVDAICVDTAHGHSRGVLDAVKAVKQKFPELQVVGGNVATGEGAKALSKAGVDGVKVGVGPGSICTTRIGARARGAPITPPFLGAPGRKGSGASSISRSRASCSARANSCSSAAQFRGMLSSCSYVFASFEKQRAAHMVCPRPPSAKVAKVIGLAPALQSRNTAPIATMSCCRLRHSATHPRVPNKESRGPVAVVRAGRSPSCTFV